MNRTERKMLDILKCLKEEYDIVAVKAEFEAEGSRTDELVMLNEVIFKADLDLYIKIGGCEAVRDLDQCRLLGASGIMAPMIESPFAMSKFVNAAKKVYGNEWEDIEWIINAETVTCLNNINSILEEGRGFLKTVSIGRSDLSASLNVKRTEIDSDYMFEKVKYMAERCKDFGYIVNFGGKLSFESIPFICNMFPINDRFETRKVVFNTTNNPKRLKDEIQKSLEFEKLYLQNKCEFYNRMAKEDESRIKRMAEMLEIADSWSV